MTLDAAAQTWLGPGSCHFDITWLRDESLEEMDKLPHRTSSPAKSSKTSLLPLAEFEAVGDALEASSVGSE